MNLVITGSSSGIGKFLADSLAAKGHAVCRLARSPQDGFSFQCDVSDWLALQNCAKSAARKWRAVDGLICCAAIQEPIGPAMEIDPAAWRPTLAANLDGTFFAIRAFYPLLRKTNRRAKIICFSGGGATSPRPNFAAYGVSKAGVVRLVETLAAEWQGQPLDINAVAPGAIFTRMTEQVLARGAAVAGKIEFERASRQSRDNGRATRKGSGVDRVSFVIKKRRHHRQTHQRGLGPVGKTSPIQEGPGQRHLHAAPHRAQRSRKDMGRQMNYAIIGCGLIGKKRLAGLPAGSKLAVACDTNLARAEELVKLAGTGRAVADYRQAVADPQVDAVIVATVNAALAEVSAAAIRAGKPVLVEKPAGVSVRQIDELIALAKEHGVCVRVGFNHRYHPAFRKAREIFESGVMGDLMFIRARYGHGGRVGYDQEWRADPKLSGGGELIDQGVHLIDLASWFLGRFTKVNGHAATFFWNMPVDDNAFLDLRTAKGRTAWLHVSCTEWKNLFSFEIYGRNAKLHIEGLGRQLRGRETLSLPDEAGNGAAGHEVI